MAGRVEFTDRSAETIKAISNLAKKGLRAGAKIIKKQALENMNERQKQTIGKLLTARAVVDRGTGQPRAEVGYISKTSDARYKRASKGVKFMPNPSWLEFGTSPHSIKAGDKRGKANITGKKALSNGVTLFGRSVRHPGGKGYKPVTKAGEQKAQAAHDAIMPYLQQIADMADSDVIREAMEIDKDLDEE